jgi:hypothetical protein
MRDRIFIILGLAVFVGLFSFPFWRGLLAREPAPAPAPVAREGATQCIRDTAWMRRHHMELLMHSRDDVVHRGIRKPEETLPGCMNCHLTRLADGSYPSVSSPEFFCNSCHIQVGVKTDCFSCHSNKPEAMVADVTSDAGTGAIGGATLPAETAAVAQRSAP